MNILYRLIIHPSSVILSELRDIASQIVEAESGHVILHLEADTWSNVYNQVALFVETYWPFLALAFTIGVLIGLLITAR